MKRILSLACLGAPLVMASLVQAVPAAALAADVSRQTIRLTVPTRLGGVLVQAGTVEVFEPGHLLAHGTLAEASTLEKLNLPVGSEIDMASPGHIDRVNLPEQVGPILLAGAPFASRSSLVFGYGEFLAHFRGEIAYHPTQYASFPTAGLNLAAFENKVTAICTIAIDHLNQDARNWNCAYELVLQTALEQKFGTQTVTLPQDTLVSFQKYGISLLKLARDQEFMGLPVSAATAMRVSNWTVNGPQGIMSLMLSKDAVYQGIPLSMKGEVDFFDATGANQPSLVSFIPLDEITVNAGEGTVVLGTAQRVYLNRDGSLHYGALAFPQSILGSLFPEKALVFFGDHQGSSLQSVGLQPFTWVTIDGVKYGNSIEGQMFIDFDENGHIRQVRD